MQEHRHVSNNDTKYCKKIIVQRLLCILVASPMYQYGGTDKKYLKLLINVCSLFESRIKV